jgi:hypothetical protein
MGGSDVISAFGGSDWAIRRQAETREKGVPTPVLTVAIDGGLPESRPGPGGSTK